MLALTCDFCEAKAVVFFLDGIAACQEHGLGFKTEYDFPQVKSGRGSVMRYDLEGRYLGLFLQH